MWSIAPSEGVFESLRVFLFAGFFGVVGYFVQNEERPFLLAALFATLIILVIVNSANFLISHFSESLFQSSSAHPNLLSSLLFFLTAFLLLHNNTDLGVARPVKWGLFIASFILIGLLQTRSVWLASGILGFVLMLNLITSKPLRAVFIGLAAIVVIAIGYGMITTNHDILNTDSMTERLFVWQNTLELIRENVLVGVGAGNWEFDWTKFGVGGYDSLGVYGIKMQRPHNDILWIISEYGLLGIGFVIAFLALVFRAGRNMKLPLFFLISFPVFFLSFPKERIEHLLVLAIVIGISLQSKYADSKAHSILRLTFLGIALFALVVGVFRWKGEMQAKSFLREANEGDRIANVATIQEARSVFYKYLPGAMPISSYIGQYFMQRGDRDQLFEWSEQAYQEAPYHYEVVTNYGVALNEKRRLRDAETITLEAYRLNQRYDGAKFNLCVIYYNMGKYELAEQWLSEIEFKTPKTDYYAGLIHLKLDAASD